MRFSSRFYICCLFAIVSASSARSLGAGGTNEIPFVQPVKGEPLKVEMETDVWGDGGDITDRYKDVRLVYAVGGEPEQAVEGKITSHTANREHYVFVLKPGKASGVLHYRFEMTFDGQKTTSQGMQKITIPATADK